MDRDHFFGTTKGIDMIDLSQRLAVNVLTRDGIAPEHFTASGVRGLLSGDDRFEHLELGDHEAIALTIRRMAKDIGPSAPESRKVTTRKSRKVHETETTIDEEDLPAEPDDGDPAPGRDRDDEEDEEEPLAARAASEDRERAIGDAARYLASHAKISHNEAIQRIVAGMPSAPKPSVSAPPPSRRMTAAEVADHAAVLAQAKAFCGIKVAS